MTSRQEREYKKVVRHFRGRIRDVDWDVWHPFAEGREGKVYVDTQRRRVLKVVVVSLEEDPVARFEMVEAVNRSASRHGVSPKVHGVYYSLSERGVLRQCIEQDLFEGDRLDALPAKVAMRVAPLVRKVIGSMVRHGLVHTDLHGGNVLVSPDHKTVRLIDFGNGSIDTRAPLSVLQAYYSRKLATSTR